MESIHRRRSKAIGGAFQMKFTFKQKLAAVKLHKEKGTYKYPKGYEAKSKKTAYRFYVQFWEAQYDRNGEESESHFKYDFSAGLIVQQEAYEQMHHKKEKQLSEPA